MLKFIGVAQLVVAPILVLPAMTGQEGDDRSLESQLDATVMSIDFLTGLRANATAGIDGSVESILRSTEAPRDTSVERASKVTTLQSDLARLRFGMEKLLADPQHLAAITSMPPSVVRALGLGGGAPAESRDMPMAGALTTTPTRPVSVPILGNAATGSAVQGNPTNATDTVDGPLTIDSTASRAAAIPPELLAGMQPTVGLGDAMRDAIRRDVGPLDDVSTSSRRRGDEPLALEEEGYVADPTRLGKLLVRAGRAAEAIEVLRGVDSHAGRYWLARALQDMDRASEAVALFEALVADPTSGPNGQHAAQDLEFLEFQTSFQRSTRR